MTTLGQASAYRKALFGNKVDRAAGTLPQTTTGALFNVAGGRVIVTGIVGQVTTAIQAQANAAKLVATPTTGAANDLCTTLDINGKALNTLLSITGSPTDALVGNGAGAVNILDAPGIVVAIGSIGLSCAASNTGGIKWSLTYVPLDDGATVTAA